MSGRKRGRGAVVASALAVLLPAVAQADRMGEAGTAGSSRAPTVRTYGGFTARLSLDTRFDSEPRDPLPENVIDLRNRLLLGAEIAQGDRTRIVLEARARHRAVSRRAPPGEPFLLVNGARAKGTLEVDVREAYLDLYTPQVDLRLGRQIFAWGANPAFAPQDALNPPDLREGGLLADPADAKVPVLAARAQGTLGPLQWTATVVPFFEPAKYHVVGQDDGIVQPAILSLSPVPDLSPFIDASVEDYRQEILVETERPKGLPQEGDIALRARLKVGPATVGASVLWAHEAVPRIKLDPELAALTAAFARGETPDFATALSVSQRLAAGEKLFRGDHPRTGVFAIEAAILVGPVEIDVDVAFKPARTVYLQDLTPVTRSSLTAVVGIADARGGHLTLSVTYGLLGVFGMARGESLLLLEPLTAVAADRVALAHGLVALAGYRFLDGDLEVDVRGAADLNQGSFAVGPRVAYRLGESWRLSAGAEFYAGPPRSPLGYLDRNDSAIAQVAAEW